MSAIDDALAAFDRERVADVKAAGIEPAVDVFGDGVYEQASTARARRNALNTKTMLEQLMQSEAAFKNPGYDTYWKQYDAEDAPSYDFYKKLTAEDFMGGPDAIRAAASRK